MRHRLVPRYNHWTLTLKNKAVDLRAASPWVLRHYWVQEDRLSSIMFFLRCSMATLLLMRFFRDIVLHGFGRYFGLSLYLIK